MNLRTLLLSSGLCLAFPAMAQDAPCEATSAQVEAATQKAFDAFLAMDPEAFEKHQKLAARAFGCLREPLSPEEAAAWHRLLALAAFLERDEEAAVARFTAARVADGETRLPETIAPEGHPLDQLFERADPEKTGAIEPLTAPDGGRIWVDGSEGAVRPVDRPAVLQIADPEGVVVQTDDVPLGGAAPDWSALRFAAPEPEPEPEPEPSVTRKGPNVPLGVAAGVAAATSGATFALASATRSRFDDPGTDFDDLDALRGQTNGLVVASGATAGLAVGLGVAAFTIEF